MRRALFIVGASVLWVVALLAFQQPGGESRPFDLVIRGGRVLDGSGNPWRRADLGIRDGRFVAIGSLGGAPARRVIEAADRYVAPGFIDTHTHAAEGLARLGLQQGQPLVAQGITTILGNPDGGGPVDLAAQRAALEKRGLGVNVGLMIGHGSVRAAVVGMDDRAPTPGELERMQALVRSAMEQGAFGLSSGLFYAPGSYARTDELVALMTTVGEAGGVHQSHIRDEGDYSVGLLASVDEVIQVAEQSRTPGVVTHLKALGPASWGLSLACIERIDRARARGVAVFADQYPYDASSTSLSAAVVPRWAHVGGGAAMRARLADPALRERLLTEMAANLRRRGGAGTLVVASYEPDRSYEGKSLAAIAAARGTSPEQATLELLAKGSVSIVSFNMSDTDIELIMRQPWTMTASDGALGFPTEGRPHPRGYGAFPRKLERYVVARRVVGLEDAIRSMTSLPAEVFGIEGRGVIREGAWADLVVFDLGVVHEATTYDDPHRLAQGMSFVLVNGVPVIDEGTFTSALPGLTLRRAR